MTPKEKAKELYEKFKPIAHAHYDERDGSFYGEEGNAKKCALIAVNEIIQVVFEKNFETEYYWHKTDYWNEVKTEIENL